MLRVSKVEEWLHRAPTRPDLSTHGDCVVIRSSHSYDGKQGVSLASGVSSQTAGAQALCLHVVMIPPGTRGMPHFHDGHESAIYTVSGETEVWHARDWSSGPSSAPGTSCTYRRAPRTCP